jgi:predicted ATPase with chaperone activity
VVRESSGFEFPQRRIAGDLAPVQLAKHGGRFDLPIALSRSLADPESSEPIEAAPRRDAAAAPAV